MTRDEAIEQLKFHSGNHEAIEDPRWENGFLPSLRPFRGLNTKAFDNLLECLDCLKAEIKDNDVLQKEIMSDLWAICHYSKAWGTHPQGMIRRNNLIADSELVQLEDWIEQLSFRISFWLDGEESPDF